MGRRSRAREREAAEAVASPEAAVPAPPRRRRNWARLLNPLKFRRLDRARARGGAIGFGLAAVVFAVVGWLTDQVAWFSSAVLLAILALVWGVSAFVLGRLDRSS
jgi:hypothetical protein